MAEVTASMGPAEPEEPKKSIWEVLAERAKNRGAKRAKHIEEHGIDPKTVNKFFPNSGIRIHQLELSEETRTRGSKHSRRRTARTWERVSSQPASD